MANQKLFTSLPGALVPRANAVNEAGGLAYGLAPEQALAQYAATGCLNQTYYASDDAQLQRLLELCARVSPEFIARTAVYCRRRGFMKDVPALLCAVLTFRDSRLLARVFGTVIDDARMLRTYVQILRSGVCGRKSFGSLPKRLIQRWFDERSDDAVFRADVGQSPSLSDIVKMVHPRPATPERAALYRYLLGKPCDPSALPPLVQAFETWKVSPDGPPPDVPFQRLTALPLGSSQWQDIARRAPWQMTRMNLNTFARHGVFSCPEITRVVAERLRNPDLIKRSRVFPYQLLVAYLQAGASVPTEVREALQDAMECAVDNVPKVRGRVVVAPDVSGSMHSPVTGHRKGSTSVVRCVDVAALVAAAILRKNPDAEVLPFECDVVRLRLNPRDSIMTNAGALASVGGGGTNCSAVLADLNRRKSKAELVIYVSDNESWMDTRPGTGPGAAPTATMVEWSRFRDRNPGARLVCLDLQPTATTQAGDRADILNVGGFSDSVFDIIAAFAKGELGDSHWTGEINKIAL